MSGKGRKARRRARMQAPSDPFGGAPSLVAVASLKRLLASGDIVNSNGRVQPRVRLRQWLPVVRGACSMLGGHVMQLPIDGDVYAWHITIGRSMRRFSSLRQMCEWIVSELDAGQAMPAMNVDRFRAQSAWVVGS